MARTVLAWLCAAALLVSCSAESAQGKTLVLATTSSIEDSGLLRYLLPRFEARHGVRVHVVAVGTGQALALGRDGNADVLLVHDAAREDAFLAAGHGVRREPVMHNDYVLVGPASDPAGVRGLTDAAEAFRRIAASRSRFVSRGDDSGTHEREMAIWRAAGIEPRGGWYVSAGQGMGEVLTMASEQLAYTLSDRATYLVHPKAASELVILAEGDPLLLNRYSAIAVNPNKGAHIQAELATRFIDWLISDEAKTLIAAYGMEEFGLSLFTPE